MIRQEGRLLLCAVQFLTRIPTPELRGFRSEWIQQSARYYSLVGQIVGSIAALTLLGATHIWGAAIGALLAVGAGIALTGGFHEDGLADTADGLGGGMTRARRLEIMKDSRLGTYGALALMLTLALRVAAGVTLVRDNFLDGITWPRPSCGSRSHENHAIWRRPGNGKGGQA